MAAVVFQICEEAENARIFLRDTFSNRYLDQGQIRGHNLAFLWGCAHSSAEAKGLWGCIWLMCLTDRACGIGLFGIRAQRGADFPDLLRFLKLLCGWWRENGSFSGVIYGVWCRLLLWTFSGGFLFVSKWTKPLPSPVAAPVVAVPLQCGFPFPESTRPQDPHLHFGSDVPSLFSQLLLHVILTPSSLSTFFGIGTGILCIIGPNNYTFVFLPFIVIFKCPFDQT